MFTQSCFIRKNTPELRMKLKQLGYKCNNGKWMGTYIATFKRDNNNDLFYCGTPEYDLPNNPSLNNSINCGTNERLFIAIASLRDGTDINQWFVHKSGAHWWLCSDFDYFKDDFESFNEDEELRAEDYHKATVKELIEFFKYK